MADRLRAGSFRKDIVMTHYSVGPISLSAIRRALRGDGADTH
jgi:hypothetical protein